MTSTGPGEPARGTAGRPGEDAVTAGPSAAAGVLQLLAALALLITVLAGGSADRAGVVLTVPVVLGLAVSGIRDLVLRPVVLADAKGLTVVRGLGRVHATWSQVVRLRVVTERRAPLLEVDLGEELVVLGRRRLGRPPASVLADLEGLRP